jgi:hydrogenase nickel incorporation protein HypA/HybF
MHEYSLACNIIEHVISIAELNNAKAVNNITIGIGKLAHVNPDQILFCLETLASDSIAQGTEFILVDIFPDMECECGYSCNSEQLIKDNDRYDDIRVFLEIPCPTCGKIMHELGGRDLVIQSIDIEQ